LYPDIYDGLGQVVFTTSQGAYGRFPFLTDRPRVYGAHYLAAMLMGVDFQGFISRASVPRPLLGTPEQWYGAVDDTGRLIHRTGPYLDPAGVRTIPTGDLLGRPNRALFPNWGLMQLLPVIVDAFDRPVLYYVPNRHGSVRNMLVTYYSPTNEYPDEPPIYYHVDNLGFTGGDDGHGWVRPGWDFGAGGRHRIARSGDKLTATDIAKPENRNTFAYTILDKHAFDALSRRDSHSPLRPVNRDTYLLITAGADAVYGSEDDVINFPRS